MPQLRELDGLQLKLELKKISQGHDPAGPGEPQLATRRADRNVQVHIGAGDVGGYAAERRICEGTTHIQRLIIARKVIGGTRTRLGIGAGRS